MAPHPHLSKSDGHPILLLPHGEPIALAADVLAESAFAECILLSLNKQFSRRR